MSSRGVVAVIAGVLLLVGVFVGFSTHKISDSAVATSASCGSAFSPSNADAGVYDVQAVMAGEGKSFAQQCTSALTGPRTVALVLVGAGLLVAVSLVLTVHPAKQRQA